LFSARRHISHHHCDYHGSPTLFAVIVDLVTARVEMPQRIPALAPTIEWDHFTDPTGGKCCCFSLWQQEEKT
jgi:hypothetical protein